MTRNTIVVRCTECGHTCDAERDQLGTPCRLHASCPGVYRRKWTPPGIALKGPGFYRTDNR